MPVVLVKLRATEGEAHQLFGNGDSAVMTCMCGDAAIPALAGLGVPGV